MPRAIWSGAISFGLVNVPVKLFSAVSRKTVRFHQLHDEDGRRIQQKRVCSADGKEVPYENIVKGYELSPDRYVVISPEELEALDPKKTRTIDIEDFVQLDEIDPIYFDHPYYLLPDKGSAKAYNLLLEAMRDSNKVAIARVVIRSKEHLTAIRATGDLLTMATMLFADEVVEPESIDEMPDDEASASAREVKMARQLIDSLTGEFDPGKYRDEYRERVLDMIERKAEGQEIAVQPPEEPTEVPDLMAALEASVAATKEGDGKAASDGKRTKARSKSRSNGAGSRGRSSKARASGRGKSGGAGKSKRTKAKKTG